MYCTDLEWLLAIFAQVPDHHCTLPTTSLLHVLQKWPPNLQLLYYMALRSFILLLKGLQRTEQVPRNYLTFRQYYSFSNNLGFVDLKLRSQ